MRNIILFILGFFVTRYVAKHPNAPKEVVANVKAMFEYQHRFGYRNIEKSD